MGFPQDAKDDKEKELRNAQQRQKSPDDEDVGQGDFKQGRLDLLVSDAPTLLSTPLSS